MWVTAVKCFASCTGSLVMNANCPLLGYTLTRPAKKNEPFLYISTGWSVEEQIPFVISVEGSYVPSEK